MPTRRDQGKFMEEVALSWLLNVNRKDGGKFIFTRGRVGIREVQNLKNAGWFWNTDETPVAMMGGMWVVSVRVMLRGD